MKLLIMGQGEASVYQPDDKTYAIRIMMSHPAFRECVPPLQNLDLYTTREYVFDDITPDLGEGVLFEESMARQIIGDFSSDRDDCSTLLVHCARGINRSPAVAMALNDIFDLGHDTEKLKKKYSEANLYVYNLMRVVGNG